MKKKLLTCAILSVAALTASAAFAGCGLFGGGNRNDDGKTYRQDNMRFELKDDGTYEFERYEYAYIEDGEGNVYTGEGETVTVPDTVNGKAVTSIANYAFGNTGVKEVTLPDVITELPDRIFDGCKLLETVNMPAVTSVGDMAFYECTNLESIEFKSGLTEIGDRAFERCPSLATVTLPDTVKTIGRNSFYESNIESINTAGVEEIGDTAFYACANLTALNLPNVVSIGASALRYCNKLAEITIGNRLETIPGNLFTDAGSLRKLSIDSPVPARMLYWNNTVTEVTLGEGVTSIGESAFEYCRGITEITLPATLTDIGERAFSQSKLSGALTIPASVKSIGYSAFYGTRITSLTIENGVESIGGSAFVSTGITSLSLPASVKSIGDTAFMYCDSLAQINFSEGLETIGGRAFSIKGAGTLDIVLPSTVKSIGGNCFGGVTANKIIINDTVESVGENVARSCTVKELTVPANYGHNATSVETLTLFGEGDIPDNAYKNCTALKTVDLGGGVKKIGANAFKALEAITLNGVEYMGSNALGDISALTYTRTEDGVNYIDDWVISTDYSNGGATGLDLSGYTGIYQGAFAKTETSDTSVFNTAALTSSEDTSKLKFIGERAFEGSGITGVMVPASLQMWDGAFRGCGALSAVAVQQGVEKIADYAFADCTNLKSINFKVSDVKEIGNSAFRGCTYLRFATLPNGIEKIGDYAFNHCEELLSIDLKGTEEIGYSAFGYCSELREATMNSVLAIGDSAFYKCTKLAEIDLPAVKSIGDRAFAESGLEAVAVPASVETWKGAFRECRSLTTVTVPRGIEKIADDAFTDCTALTEINLSDTDIKEIGNFAFSGCSKLKTVTLPDGLEKIDVCAFNNCTSLDEMTIITVKIIGNEAFYKCTALKTIDVKDAEEIGDYAFCRCVALENITMNSVKTLGQSAFYMCKATEYDLPDSVTKITDSALGNAQTVNFAGTAEQWSAIEKGMRDGKVSIWVR
ncbi:MAG: leucine-rich repeat domain-containing protein, partial [Clostridia bacterium]|nr:leucine-rich repeat domain-containing protein [Clostridia bacterium]